MGYFKKWVCKIEGKPLPKSVREVPYCPLPEEIYSEFNLNILIRDVLAAEVGCSVSDYCMYYPVDCAFEWASHEGEMEWVDFHIEGFVTEYVYDACLSWSQQL